jgi:hypothetical protein
LSLGPDREAKGETVKSYPFDDALKILANVLERDGKKNRRAKKDRRKLDNNAVRLSLRSAAQAYMANKEHWGIGPAKVRDRYIRMHKDAQKVREDIVSMRREAVIIGPLISTNPETDPVELVNDLRLLLRSLDQHLERLEAAGHWAASRVRPGNLKGSAVRNLALNCAGIFKKFTGIEPTTATDPDDHTALRYGDFIDFFSAVLCEIDPDHPITRVDDIAHKALIEWRRHRAE